MQPGRWQNLGGRLGGVSSASQLCSAQSWAQAMRSPGSHFGALSSSLFGSFSGFSSQVFLESLVYSCSFFHLPLKSCHLRVSKSNFQSIYSLCLAKNLSPSLPPGPSPPCACPKSLSPTYLPKNLSPSDSSSKDLFSMSAWAPFLTCLPQEHLTHISCPKQLTLSCKHVWAGAPWAPPPARRTSLLRTRYPSTPPVIPSTNWGNKKPPKHLTEVETASTEEESGAAWLAITLSHHAAPAREARQCSTPINLSTQR